MKTSSDLRSVCAMVLDKKRVIPAITLCLLGKNLYQPSSKTYMEIVL